MMPLGPVQFRMLSAPVISALLLLGLAPAAPAAYVPGTPGGAWTRAEVRAVKAKLRLTFRRRGGVVGEAQQGRGPVMMFRLFSM